MARGAESLEQGFQEEEAMKHIQAPNKYDHDSYKIFLAGSIEMGRAEGWQKYIVEQLGDCDDSVTILNPRRDDWDSSWEQSKNNEKFNEQVLWELSGLMEADLIVFYFSPGTISPISLMELGFVAAKNIVVCCPDGFDRKGNVDIFCDVNGIHMVESLDDLLAEIRRQIKLRLNFNFSAKFSAG